MSKKVFMIFNSTVDKRKQALWFVNTFIQEMYRDIGYLLSASQRHLQEKDCMCCDINSGTWIWVSRHNIPYVTGGMTQVFYPTKNMGEL